MAEIQEYRGKFIVIEDVDNAPNPLEHDMEAPATFIDWQGVYEIEKLGKHDWDAELTRDQITQNMPIVLDILGIESVFSLREFNPIASGQGLKVDMVGVISDAIYEECERNIYKLKQLMDIQGLVYVDNGASWQDSFFVVATKEYLGENDLIDAGRYTIRDSLMKYALLLRDYLDGDCYKYAILDPEEVSSLEFCSETFYGVNHEKSGLMDAARDHIDYCQSGYKLTAKANAKETFALFPNIAVV